MASLCLNVYDQSDENLTCKGAQRVNIAWDRRMR